MTVSAVRRREIISALRQGAVPEAGLDVFAVGLDRFVESVDEELASVTAGGAVFKAVRGEYGSGKTFFTRWLAERAKRLGFGTAEVQVSENETPLHKLETVYRRLTERLSTPSHPPSALRSVVDAWFYVLEEDALAADPELDGDKLEVAVARLLESRLAAVARTAPMFASALRGYRAALVSDDEATAEAILAWLGGQPNVAATARRSAGIRGDLDHFGALGFLQGLLAVLRDSGHPGLVLVLDEVETLQRVRSDARDKALNSLRQLIDEVHAGRFPGLYLVITGTPAFFEGPQGVQRLAPLAQRLSADFTTESRYDNPRAPQLRLPGFDMDTLVELGCAVRDLYGSDVDDAYVRQLAAAVSGKLGGQVGISPRVYLGKLVDVLDRVDQYPDFDPRRDYPITISDAGLTEVERNAARSADDIELDLP